MTPVSPILTKWAVSPAPKDIHANTSMVPYVLGRGQENVQKGVEEFNQIGTSENTRQLLGGALKGAIPGAAIAGLGLGALGAAKGYFFGDKKNRKKNMLGSALNWGLTGAVGGGLIGGIGGANKSWRETSPVLSDAGQGLFSSLLAKWRYNNAEDAYNKGEPNLYNQLVEKATLGSAEKFEDSLGVVGSQGVSKGMTEWQESKPWLARNFQTLALLTPATKYTLPFMMAPSLASAFPKNEWASKFVESVGDSNTQDTYSAIGDMFKSNPAIAERMKQRVAAGKSPDVMQDPAIYLTNS